MRLTIHAILAALAILGSVVLAQSMTAKTLMADRDGEPNYAALVPEQFGDWTIIPSLRLVMPEDSEDLSNQIYSQMFGRGYSDKSGNVVMLLVAYGPRQSDRLQLHRPEICYVAQGFRVSSSVPATLDLGEGGSALSVRRMVAQREGRTERITYWMRVGGNVVSTLFGRQVTKLRYGLQGLIPDGVLIRVSTINMDEKTAAEVQDRFLRDFMKSVANKDLPHFVGNQAVRSNRFAGVFAAQ